MTIILTFMGFLIGPGCSSKSNSESEAPLTINAQVIVTSQTKYLEITLSNHSGENICLINHEWIVDVFLYEEMDNEWYEYTHLFYLDNRNSPDINDVDFSGNPIIFIPSENYKKHQQYYTFITSIAEKVSESQITEELLPFVFIFNSVIFLKDNESITHSVDITPYFNIFPNSILKFAIGDPPNINNDPGNYSLKDLNELSTWLYENEITIPRFFDGYRVVFSDNSSSHELRVELK